VLDGGLLQELENGGEEEHLVSIDIPVGYNRIQNQFLGHGGAPVFSVPSVASDIFAAS
jgi:hypothetical protein